MNIILQTLFFKIRNSWKYAVRVLKLLSQQPNYPSYFEKLFSSVFLNNDTRLGGWIYLCLLEIIYNKSWNSVENSCFETIET